MWQGQGMPKPDTDTKLEQANRDVAEQLLARLVIWPEGSKYTGEHLLTWRNLPAVEREYFTRLTAPMTEAYVQRTQTVAAPDEHGWCAVTYDPPMPQVCDCDAPVYRNWESDWCRCAACLSSFPADSLRATKSARARP